MEQNKNLDTLRQDNSLATFLMEEDYIQIHIFGDHSWHETLRMRLAEMGVELKEQFCSPCG